MDNKSNWVDNNVYCLSCSAILLTLYSCKVVYLDNVTLHSITYLVQKWIIQRSLKVLWYKLSVNHYCTNDYKQCLLERCVHSWFVNLYLHPIIYLFFFIDFDAHVFVNYVHTHVRVVWILTLVYLLFVIIYHVYELFLLHVCKCTESIMYFTCIARIYTGIYIY